jgi:hypothetical protein
MKRLIFALCLLASPAIAQGPQPPRPGGAPTPAPALPENYLLTLTISNAGQVAAELSVVIATADFSASFPDAKPAVNVFSGTVSLETNGSVVVRYTLSLEIPIRPFGPNPQSKSSVTQSSARLLLGQPVQILKTDTRTYLLSITKASGPSSEAR